MTGFNILVLMGGICLKAMLLTWFRRPQMKARDMIINVTPRNVRYGTR